jgi:esterase/lipase superfamily enzyme
MSPFYVLIGLVILLLGVGLWGWKRFNIRSPRTLEFILFGVALLLSGSMIGMWLVACENVPLSYFSTGQYAPSASRDVETHGRDPHFVRVFFATNRRVEKAEPQDKSLPFGFGRSPDLVFGSSVVEVPKTHSLGNVERPNYTLLESRIMTWSENEKEQFILKELNVMTKDEFLHSIKSAGPSSALIFVHGFNNSFDDALFKVAQITYDSQYAGVPIAFSWPSKGDGILGYDYDRDSASYSLGAFQQLLYAIQHGAGVSKIHIVAHSMGNQIVTQALAQAVRNGVRLKISEVIFAAPDVDNDIFIQLSREIKPIAKGFTLYASSADWALKASQAKASGLRAGELFNGEPLVLRGVESIDVSALGQMFDLNHDTYSSNRSVIGDISRIMSGSTRPPNVRSIEIRPVPDLVGVEPRFWRFSP